MRIPRLLLLLFFSMASIAPVAAQSSLTQAQLSQATPDFSHRGPQFQLPIPGYAQNGQASTRIEFQPPATIPMTVSVQQNATCYFIQVFRFAPVTSGSDALKLVGVTTCQPAAQYQMRDATP